MAPPPKRAESWICRQALPIVHPNLFLPCSWNDTHILSLTTLINQSRSISLPARPAAWNSERCQWNTGLCSKQGYGGWREGRVGEPSDDLDRIQIQIPGHLSGGKKKNEQTCVCMCVSMHVYAHLCTCGGAELYRRPGIKLSMILNSVLITTLLTLWREENDPMTSNLAQSISKSFLIFLPSISSPFFFFSIFSSPFLRWPFPLSIPHLLCVFVVHRIFLQWKNPQDLRTIN